MEDLDACCDQSMKEKHTMFVVIFKTKSTVFENEYQVDEKLYKNNEITTLLHLILIDAHLYVRTGHTILKIYDSP